MTEAHQKLPSFAKLWWEQRRLGYKRLEKAKLEELRKMTEQEAAQIFDQLDPVRPYAIRDTSGLVEQQRLFRMLREKHLLNNSK